MHKVKRNAQIRYVNPEQPNIGLPEVRGETYPARVPDTIDLAEQARHAVHGMTAMTDPDANGELYWVAGFGWQPPTMYHDANDWCEFKFFSPSLLLRQACGSDEGMDVEQHRMTTLCQMQAPNGLLYIPLIGRPWGRHFGCEGDMFDTGTADHMMPLLFQGRLLSVAATYHAATGDPRWLQLAERLLAALRSLAIDKGDHAYFDKTIYAPGEGKTEVPVPPPSISHATAWVGNGLMDYYRMTGSEGALDLAYKLARLHASRRSGFVGPNGEFRGSHGTRTFEGLATDPVHFHCNTHIRMLMLDAGIAKGDREMIDLAVAGYEYGRDHGDTLMGFFPENVDADKKIGPDAYGTTAEICEVAEMVYLALRQSTAGLSDRWEDVDRWMRNIVTEAQLLQTDWAYDHAAGSGVPLEQDPYPRAEAVIHTKVTEHVPERCRGTWGGWLLANDWQGTGTTAGARSIMTCCVGNMGMHFYRVWRDMVSYAPAQRRFSVHLLMNRGSRWADVASHIPYQGRVDVKLKQDAELALRIPEWAQRSACRCTINGKPATPSWEGRYLVVPARRGDEVSLDCPIQERREKRTIMSKDYALVVRGNEIVDIDPPGRICPIFRRPQYRQEKTRWRDVTRFVSEQEVAAY